MSLFGDIGVATRNGFKRMVEARQAHARSYVNGALLSLDDKTLAELGFDRREIEKQPHRRGTMV